MQKKLLYITNQICGAGGLERVLSLKASYFADLKRYEVHILTLNQGDLPLFYQFSSNIHFHDILAQGNVAQYLLAYLKGINEVIKEVGPDIISVCDDGLKGLFVPLFFRKSIPIVYERHTVKKRVFMSVEKTGLFHKMRNYFINKFADFGSSLFDRFVVLTHQNTQEWPKARLAVIPNPTPFYASQPAPLKHKRVISVGTMNYIKGFDQLLKAWEIVTERYPDWKLDIYGKPLLAEELIKLSLKLGISDKINLNNPVTNIEDKYLESSIYVLSSRFEGFGMVLIEAMACGLPCVSFNCPHGPADIITDHEDGYLVSSGDIKTLSDRIMELIEDENKRQRMGERARKNVKRYMPEQIIGKWDTLFKELV